MFGDPLFGTKIGDVPGIKKSVSAAGVRSVGNDGGDDLGDICPHCGMMPIDGQCSCSSEQSPMMSYLEEMCDGCGMPSSQCMCAAKESCPVCNSSPCQCGKEEGVVCPSCEMMSPEIDSPCSCELNLSEAKSHCEGCGMSEDVCECGYMNELTDEARCNECGMDESVCECGYMNEAKKKGKGPSKKTAKKILRGTKTFKDKMKKVSGWASDPAAAAAWMMHKATGKWPSEK